MNRIRTEYCKENGYTYLESDNPNIKQYLTYLEDKLETAINYTRCCEELKAVDITDVEDIPDPYWKEYIEGKQ